MVDRSYRLRVGATFRALINDLKRDEATAAAELGVELSTLRQMLAGEREIPPEVVQRAVLIWPVNERDLCALHDDCPDGVRLMRRAESEASSRILDRGGRGYYEYRDTAMSRLSAFRPEWIRMIQVVDGEDPDDPRVEWNRGHLLHQFTYFVGPVNYYWQWEGRRFCAAMSTGDSVWGVPFAPHSFASRGAGEAAFILALTYGAGLVGDAQQELSALGTAAARSYALPVEDQDAAQAAVLRMHVASAGLTVAALERLTGVPAARIESMLAGTVRPGERDLVRLAAGLEVHPRDLVPVTADLTGGVRMVRHADALSWGVPDGRAPGYVLRRLAGSRLHPFTRALEVEVRAAGGRPEPVALVSGLHQYVYCLGPGPVRFAWSFGERRFEERLEAGDSAYVRPFVPHRWQRQEPGQACRLLVLRIAGKVRGEAMTELGAMPAEGLARTVAEDGQWYDPAGRRALAATGEA